MVRLPALTGLRIFAALAVYASHVGPPHGASGAAKAFFESGYMGVTLFFVLSGFVLCVTYSERLYRPSLRGIKNFGVARFARIYPLYILVLVYLLLRQHVLGGSNASYWWEHVLMIQAWDTNLVHAYGFNGPAWSVSVEFFLYASFPLLILPLSRLRTPRAVVVTGATIAAAMAALAAWFVIDKRADLSWFNPESAHHWLYVMPATRLGDFALGILAARLYGQVRSRHGIERIGAIVAGVAGLVILALMAWPANLFSAWSWDVAYAVPSVALIFGLAVAPSSRFARVLSLPALVLLGESSYAFYLIHQPMIEYLGAGRWGLGLSMSTVAYEALTLGIIICLAIGLHLGIERPARLYIRRFSDLDRRRREQHRPRDPEQVLAGVSTETPVI